MIAGWNLFQNGDINQIKQIDNGMLEQTGPICRKLRIIWKLAVQGGDHF